MPKGFGIGDHKREKPGTSKSAPTFGHTVACMTLAWLITAFLALNTFRKVLWAAKSFSDDSVVEGKHTHLVCLAVYKEPIDVLIETIDSIARCVRKLLMQSTKGFYPFI